MSAKHFTLIISIFLFNKLYAQTCTHTTLSNKFDYKVTRVITNKTITGNLNSKIIVQVSDKKTKKLVQKIIIKADLLLDTAYRDCSKVRSYITGENKNAETPDCDFGDFVIADLNFDGQEDFAIKYDSGGHSGPLYAFYLQDDQTTFKKNKYLTENMSHFPSVIDPKNKTLTTDVVADIYGYNETIFTYNTSTKQWSLIKKGYIKAK